MTVTELKEFLDERLEKIEKAIDKFNDKFITLEKLKFQVRLLWAVVVGSIGLSGTIIVKYLWSVVFSKIGG